LRSLGVQKGVSLPFDKLRRASQRPRLSPCQGQTIIKKDR
jgi:hypothetical protein